jgi:hypothetical protein
MITELLIFAYQRDIFRWRYSSNRFTIMGKKKRSVDDEEASLKVLESLFDKTYENIVKRAHDKELKKLDPLSFDRYSLVGCLWFAEI